MEIHHAPIAQFNGQRWVEQQNAIAGHQRPLVVLAVNIDMFEVGQHADQDLPGAKRLQPGRIEVLLIFEDLGETLAAVLLIEKAALFVGIDIERLVSAKGAAYHKVERHADALDAQAQTSAYLHIDQRERQRNAQASLQHPVEEAVLGIVVIDPVAPKSLLLKEYSVHGGQHNKVLVLCERRRRGPLLLGLQTQADRKST